VILAQGKGGDRAAEIDHYRCQDAPGRAAAHLTFKIPAPAGDGAVLAPGAGMRGTGGELDDAGERSSTQLDGYRHGRVGRRRAGAEHAKVSSPPAVHAAAYDGAGEPAAGDDPLGCDGLAGAVQNRRRHRALAGDAIAEGRDTD
jgi:hypothetical protein